MIPAGPLSARLRLPVIASPLFIISSPELVIAQCTSGVIGSFPALNARPVAQLDEWLHQIREALTEWDRNNPDAPAAPFAVNQIVHKSNARLDEDLALCVKHRVPIVITSLGAREDVNQAVQSYGGVTLHDVVNDRFAHKAIEKGATGLIPVAAGAGGHAGTTSPFALMQEIRQWFDGPVVLSGAIACGRSVLAAQAMGADFAYVGSAFIATSEANAITAHKQMIVDSMADDIIYTNIYSGMPGNYLRPSLIRAGIEPDEGRAGHVTMDFGGGGESEAKVWRDIWGSGQGIGAIDAIMPVGTLIDRLACEYVTAQGDLWRRTAQAAAA